VMGTAMKLTGVVGDSVTRNQPAGYNEAGK
jgi:hypothetical protein